MVNIWGKKKWLRLGRDFGTFYNSVGELLNALKLPDRSQKSISFILDKDSGMAACNGIVEPKDMCHPSAFWYITPFKTTQR